MNNDRERVKVQFSAGKSPVAEAHAVLMLRPIGEHLHLQQAKLD